VVLRLVERTDVLIEGLRPGVTERLGLAPSECMQCNPLLVYSRMTGWGQSGPYAQMAGHDINYIAVAGVLEGIGRPGAAPTPPLNYVGDCSGGSMFLVFGILSALYEIGRSARGQVLDAAMLDGAVTLNAGNYSMLAQGWNVKRGSTCCPAPPRTTTRTSVVTASGSRSRPTSPGSATSCARSWI
jgi:alpha-methylacyl-CoA racemase